MRIEKLTTSPDRAGRYAVRFDDGSTLRLYRQTVEDFGLYTGMELSQQAYTDLVRSAGKMSAKMRAVRIVSASGVSKGDLQQRLVRKGEDPSDAREAVDWMTELNLLDDKKTAQQVIYSCIHKGYGINRARQALYEKRIPKDIWEEVLADYPDQQDAIAQFLRSRLTADSDSREVKRAVDSLLRKGHTYGTIRRVLAQLSFDTDEFPEE